MLYGLESVMVSRLRNLQTLVSIVVLVLLGASATSWSQDVLSSSGSTYIRANAYTSIQLAINALPSGGTVFVPSGTIFDSGGLTIEAPVHLIFDEGTFAYSGNSNTPAIFCYGVPGVIIEGSGSGHGANAGTVITVTGTGTGINGITATGCDGIQIKNMEFEFISGACVSCYGARISSSRFLLQSDHFSSFSSHGVFIDGGPMIKNANLGVVLSVRSDYNGGSGFYSTNSNGQVTSFIGADAACNAGDGFTIGNQGNTFSSTNTNGNGDISSPLSTCQTFKSNSIGYHFISGAIANSGSFYSDAPADEKIGAMFESGALGNILMPLSTLAPNEFAGGANSNELLGALVTVPNNQDMGAGNRYELGPSVWNAGNFTILTATTGDIANLTVDNSLTAGTGNFTGLTAGTGNITNLSVGGSLTGGAGNFASLTAGAGSIAVIGSGTFALSTNAMSGPNCLDAQPGIHVPGVTASSHVTWDFATDPLNVRGYGASPFGAIQIYAFAALNYVYFRQCSAVAVNPGPGAMSINWEVH